MKSEFVISAICFGFLSISCLGNENDTSGGVNSGNEDQVLNDPELVLTPGEYTLHFTKLADDTCEVTPSDKLSVLKVVGDEFELQFGEESNSARYRGPMGKSEAKLVYSEVRDSCTEIHATIVIWPIESGIWGILTSKTDSCFLEEPCTSSLAVTTIAD